MQLDSLAVNYDKRLQTETLEWMVKFDEYLTHACTFTMEQFDNNLTAEQAWICWQHFSNRLNYKIYKNAAKRYNKTLLILPVLHGEISGKNLHFHAAIGCVDRDYSFEKLKALINGTWREIKCAKHETEVLSYIDSGWLSYMLHESVRLDLNSVDLTRACIPQALKA